MDGLVEFLKNPHAVRPSGRMPNMQLTHFEAVDIANFLINTTPDPFRGTKPNRDLVRIGKQLFKELNCGRCHTSFLDSEIASPSKIAMEKLRPNQGCLSANQGGWPSFSLSDAEKSSIKNALGKTNDELNSEQQIQLTLQSFNCYACHDRGGIGGVADARSVHFKTDNLNLGEQGRIPPTLSGVGAKLNPKWIREVLVNGRSARPYMKTRMPKFGEENISHLVNLFDSTDKLSETKYPEFKDQKEMRNTGLQLAGGKGLNCVACHTYQYKPSDTMPAVDLTEMTERLKKDWFHQYMLAPQKFSPNTVMPSFWPGGVAIRKDLDGTPELQVEALWQYLIDGRQARMPSGVVREPLEIVVTNEARMLRRSYPGIGKRGIGVGYPDGVNIAYDAEQMRLAMLWSGKFVDPGGVWRGQGHGQVRPMNRPINFGKGPELDSADSPWVVDESRPPKHKFKGYLLDKLQRPTFRYEFDGISVNDFFKEFVNEETKRTGLRREVTLMSDQARDGLGFRIATAKSIEQIGENHFSIDGELKVKVINGPTATIEGKEEKTLRVPLNTKANKGEWLILEYQWE